MEETRLREIIGYMRETIEELAVELAKEKRKTKQLKEDIEKVINRSDEELCRATYENTHITSNVKIK